VRNDEAPPGKIRTAEAPSLVAIEGQQNLVDPSRLDQLEDIARDRSFLTELVRGFISDVDLILSKIDFALSENDRAAIPDLLHSLKGAAVGVGASKLAALAMEMDRPIGDLKVAEMKRRLSDLRACSKSTTAFLNQYLQSHHHV
jgi:HPt (histidine-containing phosphotransfer) domain-containing protein